MSKAVGTDADEESFNTGFEQVYPIDRVFINSKQQFEEGNMPSGKRHPMLHPNVCVKEMCWIVR